MLLAGRLRVTFGICRSINLAGHLRIIRRLLGMRGLGELLPKGVPEKGEFHFAQGVRQSTQFGKARADAQNGTSPFWGERSARSLKTHGCSSRALGREEVPLTIHGRSVMENILKSRSGECLFVPEPA